MCSGHDDRLLARTLALACKGEAAVSPNPMVGAVVARGRQVLAEGYHERHGDRHAEAVALEKAGERARGAALYCNLEPCSFDSPAKNQPPCTRAIIESGIRRVVVGQLDPNPLVRGDGVAQLRTAGINVDVADDRRCWYLNAAFNTRMALGRPYVHLKGAVSLDGRIAAAGGASRWITDEAARREVHGLRRGADAVAVGVGTLLADDPLLTARLDAAGDSGKQPAAVVFDTHLRTPPASRLVRERADSLFVVGVRPSADERWEARADALSARGVTVIAVGELGAREWVPGKLVPLEPALRALLGYGVGSILVEGGSALSTSLVSASLYDRITLYIAPLLMGDGVPFVGDLGIADPGAAVRFEDARWRAVADQQVFEAARAGWLDAVRGCVQAEVHDVHRAG